MGICFLQLIKNREKDAEHWLVASHGCTLWMIVKELSDRGVVHITIHCAMWHKVWYTVCLQCGVRCEYHVVYGVHVLSGGYLSAVGRLFHRNASQCNVAFNRGF